MYLKGFIRLIVYFGSVLDPTRTINVLQVYHIINDKSISTCISAGFSLCARTKLTEHCGIRALKIISGWSIQLLKEFFISIQYLTVWFHSYMFRLRICLYKLYVQSLHHVLQRTYSLLHAADSRSSAHLNREDATQDETCEDGTWYSTPKSATSRTSAKTLYWMQHTTPYYWEKQVQTPSACTEDHWRTKIDRPAMSQWLNFLLSHAHQLNLYQKYLCNIECTYHAVHFLDKLYPLIWYRNVSTVICFCMFYPRKRNASFLTIFMKFVLYLLLCLISIKKLLAPLTATIWSVEYIQQHVPTNLPRQSEYMYLHDNESDLLRHMLLRVGCPYNACEKSDKPINYFNTTSTL